MYSKLSINTISFYESKEKEDSCKYLCFYIESM